LRYQLNLNKFEFEYLRQVMWSHGFTLDKEYDAEKNQTHQSIWEKIRKLEK